MGFFFFFPKLSLFLSFLVLGNRVLRTESVNFGRFFFDHSFVWDGLGKEIRQAEKKKKKKKISQKRVEKKSKKTKKKKKSKMKETK